MARNRARATKRSSTRAAARQLLRVAGRPAVRGRGPARAVSRKAIRAAARPAVTGRLRGGRVGGRGARMRMGLLVGAVAGVLAGAAALIAGWRSRDRTRRKATWTRDRLMGVAREVTRRSHAPANDQDLVQQVRSDVLGKQRWKPYTINVDACDGTVTLRGQVDDLRALEKLEHEVAKVRGVVQVENLLHLPGDPASNIVDAQQASRRAQGEAPPPTRSVE